MAKHSPTPWRIADGMSETIVDALSRVQASAANAETAAYIVEAANNYEVLIQERRRLIGELDSVKAQLDWHKRQLKAVKSDAESEERWANQYFEQAQKAEAERERLRDLVRRMIPAVEEAFAVARELGESVKGICALKGVDSGEVDVVLNQWTSLLNEAREAIGKEEP